MSVEAMAVSAIVEEGSSALRKLYAEGVSSEDFLLYDEEFKWIERRLTAKKTLNRRVFRQRFPEFEWAKAKESVKDLAAELKEERAFEQVNELLATMNERLEKDNALELAVEVREKLSQVTRAYMPMSDADLDEYQETIREMKEGMRLAKMGERIGIPTGFAHLDHHWGGLMPGQFIGVLGRTGEGKSYKMTAFGWNAKKHGYSVGLFCPEHSKHEVKCRYHTLASADKDVQKACKLKHSFRNRALMNRRGFNLKSYERFCQYMKEMPGRFHLLAGTHRAGQMTVGYIEDRIIELGLDLVLIDPIYLLAPVRQNKDGNSYQEVAWIAEAVHRLSETYNVPIVFTNQSHMASKREDAPHKDDSFGAKAMMHLADYVIGVRHFAEDNRMKVRGTKSRFGSTFAYEMAFFANTGVFRERTDLFGNYLNGQDDPDDEEMDQIIKNATRGGKDE